MRYCSLKIIIKVLLFILMPVLLLTTLYFPYQEIKRNTIASFYLEEKLIAKQAAKSLEEYFGQFERHLNHYAQEPDVVRMDESGIKILNTFYDFYKGHVKAITRVNEKGVITYTFPYNEKAVGADISYQKHVNKMLKTRSTVMSDVFKAVQGFDGISLAVPVFQNGEFKGSVAVVLSFGDIAGKYVETIKIGEAGYAWMISKDGTEIYCPVPGHVGKNIEETSYRFPSVLALAEKMKSGEEGEGIYYYNAVKEKGTERLRKYAVYVPVKLFDNYWSLAVATPEEQVLGTMENFRDKWLFFTIISIMIICIYVYYMSKYFAINSMNSKLKYKVNDEIRKREQQEQIMLQQARFTAMGEMISAIAHQWRQPLSALGMNIQDLEDAYESGEMDEEYIHSMGSRSMDIIKHMSKTIDDFRNFFSPDKEKEKLDLRAIVLSVFSMVKHQMEGVEIYFNFRCSCKGKSTDMLVGTCPECSNDLESEIYGYVGEVKQVLLNLFQNSRDAIVLKRKKDGIYKGFIDVFIEFSDEKVKLHVRDNGGGIPEHILDKIYDPYFTTKEKNLGTGVGLFMSKTIIEEHMSGRLSVENRADGAEFIIMFPVRK